MSDAASLERQNKDLTIQCRALLVSHVQLPFHFSYAYFSEKWRN